MDRTAANMRLSATLDDLFGPVADGPPLVVRGTPTAAALPPASGLMPRAAGARLPASAGAVVLPIAQAISGRAARV